ncbi:MAG: 2-dehydropantoate 2-reductase [Candidatus Marinimicrobia bacterium]|nr:2-dehydropantoate 2-reductase [Candidatus Neomarinimicrobiota bacterium]
MTDNSNTPIKIGIIGAGPVGLTLSAHLIEAGAFIVLCDIDEEKIDEIKKSGIKLTRTLNKEIKVDQVCYSVDELKDYDLDLVIIAIKTTVLQIVVDQLSKIDDEKMFVMCAQNGIDNELIAAEKFGKDRTLRMVINYAGGMENLNTVAVTFFNPPNYVAPLTSGGKSIAEKIADLLNRVTLKTDICNAAEIQNHVWEKGILNAALSGLCAISHRTMKEVMSFPETVDMVTGIIDESIQVAKKENIEIRDGFRQASIEYLTKAGNHKPSMLIDIENGVKTEIDQLNGTIVEYGKKYGINTPLNQGVTALIHLHEKKKMGVYFLGIDLGSSYTKFAVTDDSGGLVLNNVIPTLSRNKGMFRNQLTKINKQFSIKQICTTGYGRDTFDGDIKKTELICASAGVSALFPEHKCIIDIGGEDIKIIESGHDGKVINFYMNDKCSAGTGTFITEIADKAELEIGEMSDLAKLSSGSSIINSFCTVFAKSEILGWKFNNIPIEEIAKGIYLSIVTRIRKLPVKTHIPIILCGGVIAFHPYLQELLSEEFEVEVSIAPNPQYMVALGASILAMKNEA